MWKGGVRDLKMELGDRLTPGQLCSHRFSSSDCQVGPKAGMGVFAVFLSSYLVVVGPWIRVFAPDWSRVCFFGLMRCHGHVGACVAARRHVAWCGSHRAHMMSSEYLSHAGSEVCK
jgi:hypothetical protein